MTKIIVSICALGTRGKAAGVVFIAKKNSDGLYVLNKKTSSPERGNTTNHARNKIYASNLDEAKKLLETDSYLINLTSADGKRALRAYDKVKIDYA